MKPQETVDYHIKATWHALTRMHNRIATDYDLSQTTAYVLINVDKEGTPATKIAPLMGMEPTSLSRLLKSMEDKGLLFRQSDKIDKRIVRIFLTKEGVCKKKLALEVVRRFNENIQKNIPKEDLDIFFNVIRSINSLTADFNPGNLNITE